CGKVEESVEYSQPTVFKGTYRHRIDAKGRLPVPAAFRRELAEKATSSVVVTLLDQCLAAYPPDEWARLEEQLGALPAFSRPVKALTRLLASRAADCAALEGQPAARLALRGRVRPVTRRLARGAPACDFDVRGRTPLPPPLRERARLGQDVVVVGVLNRFEVWAPAAWESFLRE